MVNRHAGLEHIDCLLEDSQLDFVSNSANNQCIFITMMECVGINLVTDYFMDLVISSVENVFHNG